MQYSDEDALNEMDKLLIKWGGWAKSGLGLKLNFPSAANFTKQLPSKSRTIQITDDLAVKVDEAVAALKVVGLHDFHEITYLHYVAGMPLNEIARRMGRGETLIRQYKKAILGFICGRMLDGGAV